MYSFPFLILCIQFPCHAFSTLIFYFPSLSVVQCILISFTTIYLKNIKQIRTLMIFKNYNMVVVIKCQICARVLPEWFSIYLLPPPKSYVVFPLITLLKKKNSLRGIQWWVQCRRQINDPLSKDVHSLNPAACECATWQKGFTDVMVVINLKIGGSS